MFWVPEQLREKDRFLVTIILNDEMLPEGAVEAGTVAEVHLRVLSLVLLAPAVLSTMVRMFLQ